MELEGGRGWKRGGAKGRGPALQKVRTRWLAWELSERVFRESFVRTRWLTRELSGRVLCGPGGWPERVRMGTVERVTEKVAG